MSGSSPSRAARSTRRPNRRTAGLWRARVAMAPWGALAGAAWGTGRLAGQSSARSRSLSRSLASIALMIARAMSAEIGVTALCARPAPPRWRGLW